MSKTTFQRRSGLSALLLKVFDRKAYDEYKFQRRMQACMEPQEFTPALGAEAHFKHSGNLGDLVYALPALLALAEGRPAHIHMRLDAPAHYGGKPHPLGNVMFNARMLDLVRPLLLAQPGIAGCTAWAENARIDFDLDLVRDYPLHIRYGSLARNYFQVFATGADLGKPWLTVDPEPGLRDTIVMARSQRHHAPGLDYRFLAGRKPLFVGVEAEFLEMRTMVPDLTWRPVEDFLELARIIAGSGLFIGNQSFPFAIAEALKARRILEVCPASPNVIVAGPDGFDTPFQRQMEALVAKLMPG